LVRGAEAGQNGIRALLREVASAFPAMAVVAIIATAIEAAHQAVMRQNTA
jgi:hypothetical protein